jgi:hypothetical protein
MMLGTCAPPATDQLLPRRVVRAVESPPARD